MSTRLLYSHFRKYHSNSFKSSQWLIYITSSIHCNSFLFISCAWGVKLKTTEDKGGGGGDDGDSSAKQDHQSLSWTKLVLVGVEKDFSLHMTIWGLMCLLLTVFQLLLTWLSAMLQYHLRKTETSLYSEIPVVPPPWKLIFDHLNHVVRRQFIKGEKIIFVVLCSNVPIFRSRSLWSPMNL